MFFPESPDNLRASAFLGDTMKCCIFSRLILKPSGRRVARTRHQRTEANTGPALSMFMPRLTLPVNVSIVIPIAPPGRRSDANANLLGFLLQPASGILLCRLRAHLPVAAVILNGDIKMLNYTITSTSHFRHYTQFSVQDHGAAEKSLWSGFPITPAPFAKANIVGYVPPATVRTQ